MELGCYHVNPAKWLGRDRVSKQGVSFVMLHFIWWHQTTTDAVKWATFYGQGRIFYKLITGTNHCELYCFQLQTMAGVLTVPFLDGMESWSVCVCGNASDRGYHPHVDVQTHGRVSGK